jgi:hypothetical protein
LVTVAALLLSDSQRKVRTARSRRRALSLWLLVLCLTGLSAPLRAQTLDDGIMLGRNQLCTGVFYSHDAWDHYWEGTVNRTNGNLGTVTTQTAEWTGNYAITNQLDILATTPYVWTNASQGVLHGQRGLQDLSLAAKYKALSLPVKNFGALRTIFVLSGNLPMTNYTPDLEPLSLGTHSKRIAGRGTLNYLGRNGLYLNGTAQYTFRGKVTLDRSSYYTNGQLYFSNQVAMPNQFEYGFAGGYRKNDTTLTVNFTQQDTHGGGDIRIQDSPFVSNRVNFSKIGATVTYPIPHVHQLQFWFIYANTFAGRNVGQANTYTTGFLYTFKFEKGRPSL